MKPNVIKIVGAVLPIVSVGLSIASNWFEKKELDEKVAEKVAEALKNHK